MTTQTTEHTNSGNQQLHPVIYRLLEKKGLSGESLEEFISWNLNELPDLTAMHDCEKTALRIIKSIDTGEKIGIYGDYDVDGTTSCALFYHFFKFLDIEVELIQPSRFIEGYGIHPSSIDQAIEKNIQLLITVDCGITNSEAADYALERGLTLIITDHHKDAREEMPKAYAIVNPNRRDEPADSPLKVMAGVTVAFAVCLKVKQILEKNGRKLPTLYPLLQFVATGTICDLAHLSPLNMKLVRHGLKQLPQSQYPGFRQFFPQEERNRPMAFSEKLSFHIGPMINSKGRLDHPDKSLRLLIADNSDDAYENYSHLEISNNERKFIQSNVFKEAKELALNEITGDELTCCIVYSPDWHEGVIGIVASKLVESFKVPAIVFTKSEQKGVLKASARSAGGLDLFSALKDQEDFFLKFGGHKAAAGLSLKEENYEGFKQAFKNSLKSLPAIERTEQFIYDLEVAPNEIDPDLAKQLELLEPFGMGNPRPLFKATALELDSYDILKELHVRWNFIAHNPDGTKSRFKGISFNHIGKWDTPHPEEIFQNKNKRDAQMSVYFTLGINRFKGHEYLQLMVNKIEI